MSGAPLREGEAAAILSFRDVTEPRRIENELRRTKEFLEKLVDNTVDAVVALDMNGALHPVQQGRRGAHRLQRAGGAGGSSPRRSFFVGEGVVGELLERMRSAEHGGPGRLALIRQEIVSKSGEKVPVNMTGSILYEGTARWRRWASSATCATGCSSSASSPTPPCRLERSERSAEMIALAGTAAHELNQPLTSVLGYAELLKRKLAPDDYAWAKVDIIQKEAERMKEIVRKIGRITRFETKAYVGEARILDLERASDEDSRPRLQGVGRRPLRVVHGSKNMESLRVLPYPGFLTGCSVRDVGCSFTSPLNYPGFQRDPPVVRPRARWPAWRHR